MKNLFKVLSGLALTTTMAFAADSVDIDVTVTTEAAACTPTLSNNGVVDFGKRNAASLSPSYFTQWGSRNITLNISCEASTAVAITARDSRSESLHFGKDKNGNSGPEVTTQGQAFISSPDRLFGLGKTAEGKNIGSYAILIDNNNVLAQDGANPVAVSIVGASATEGPWSLTSPAALSSNMNAWYTFSRKNSTAVQPITSAVIPLRVSASLADGLASGNTINLDGLATISLVYL